MATRYERVVLDLEDRFTGPTLRAAAAAQTLDKSLNDVSGDSVRTQRSMDSTSRSFKKSGTESEKASQSIDKYSGRLELLVGTAAALGPALIPIGSLAVPAVAGLANQFGIAALAAGTLVGSMQGIGDAVKKLEVARTAPTDASIEAARVAMSKLSTEGQDFARTLQGFLPTLRDVRDAGGAGWFPGLTDALKQIEKLAPRAEEFFYKVGQAGGDIAKDSAISLTSKRWRDFFDFLGNEAPKIMQDLAATTGDLAHGLAELWMAFTPTNNAFSSWMRDAADSFDKWATGLSKTQGFQEFIAYIQQNGPVVGEALGNIGNALLQIIEAAAPLGGPTLHALAAIADVIAKIADSDLGTPLLALVQITSAMKLMKAGAATSFGQIVTGQREATLGFTKLSGTVKTFTADLKAASSYGYMGRVTGEQTAAVGRLSGQFKTLGKQAAVVGGLALATSDLGDKIGYSNTASLALMGTMAGPFGTAIGATIGMTMDAAAANDDYTQSIKAVQAQIDAGMKDPGSADTAGLDAQIAAAKAKLAELKSNVSSGGFMSGLTHPFGTLKNSVEGIFGSSDVEEAQAAMDAAKRSLAELEGAKKAASTDTGLYRLYQMETQALNDNIEAMRTKRAEAARGLNAELDYKASLLDAADALKTNGVTVDENTRAGQANLRALYGIATAWNGQSDAAKNAQGSLKEARANFIKTAEAMGMGEDKAKRLAKALFEIPPKRTTKIDVETDMAAAKIRGLQSQLDTISKPHFIKIGVRAPNLSGFGAQVGSFDVGGYTGRGGKFEPAGVVHRREFVFSSEATDGNEAFLSSLHRSLRGYAGGGYVGHVPARAQQVMSSSTSTVEIDYDRLAAAMENARPLYGDQYIQPHNYSEFTRQQEQDRRAAGLGGRRR